MVFTWMTSQSWNLKSQLFIFPRGLWLCGPLRCWFCTYTCQSHHLLCPTVMLAWRLGASQIQASTAAVCPRRQSAQAGTAAWTATATTWLTCRLLPSLCAEDSQTTERSQKVEFSLKKHKHCVAGAEHKLKRCVCVITEQFHKKIISYQQFAENPSIIDDPNLVVRIGSKWDNLTAVLSYSYFTGLPVITDRFLLYAQYL